MHFILLQYVIVKLHDTEFFLYLSKLVTLFRLRSTSERGMSFRQAPMLNIFL